MPDINKIGKEIMSGKDAEKLKDIMNSADGKKLSGMLNPDEVNRAASEGDTKTLQGILTQVLSTDEGKRLAKAVSDAMGKNKK